MEGIRLIAAVATDGSIGADNKMLWRIAEDLKYYKARTTDNVVIMGNNTYKTLPKVALKNREHIIISSDETLLDYEIDENSTLYFRTSVEDALELARYITKTRGLDIYVAGGQSVYEQLLPHCDYAYITWVDESFVNKADKFFPMSEFISSFELMSQSEDWLETEEGLKYKFTTYKKIK